MSLQYINFKNLTLSKGWLDTAFKLKSLQLCDANVISIEDNAFDTEPFHEILRLELISVPIRVFKSGVFNGLQNLKFISLESVRVFEFGMNVLAPVPKLQSFTLKNCGSQLLKIDHLFGMIQMKKLETVDIRKCNLQDTITEETFSGLYNIQLLVLSSNGIKRIAPKSFDYIFETASIVLLNGNNLTTIPKDLFTIKTKREIKVTVNLHNNPFHCDCGLEHLRAISQEATMVQFSQMTCATPPELAGVILQNSEPFCNEIVVEEVAVEAEADKKIEIIEIEPSSSDKPIDESNAVNSLKPPSPLISPNPTISPNSSNFSDLKDPPNSSDAQSPPPSPNSPLFPCTPSNSFKVQCKITRSMPNFQFRKEVTMKKKSRFQLRVEEENLFIKADDLGSL